MPFQLTLYMIEANSLDDFQKHLLIVSCTSVYTLIEICIVINNNNNNKTAHKHLLHCVLDLCCGLGPTGLLVWFMVALVGN